VRARASTACAGPPPATDRRSARDAEASRALRLLHPGDACQAAPTEVRVLRALRGTDSPCRPASEWTAAAAGAGAGGANAFADCHIRGPAGVFMPGRQRSPVAPPMQEETCSTRPGSHPPRSPA
jgi:hypothetical protein